MALVETKSHQNYIGGRWVDAASGETFESASPANGEPIGTFPRSDEKDVQEAVAAAKAAFESLSAVWAKELEGSGVTANVLV